MAKYYSVPSAVEAVQFLYVDEVDGPQTIQQAEELGLSRNGDGGISKLWEIQTLYGWQIVRHQDWLVTDNLGNKHVYSSTAFQRIYSLLSEDLESENSVQQLLTELRALWPAGLEGFLKELTQNLPRQGPLREITEKYQVKMHLLRQWYQTQLGRFNISKNGEKDEQRKD